jgi:hypothetical protein
MTPLPAVATTLYPESPNYAPACCITASKKASEKHHLDLDVVFAVLFA